jgi:hypothetical protein
MISSNEAKVLSCAMIQEKEKTHVIVDNFRLQALLSFLNPDEKLATGIMNEAGSGARKRTKTDNFLVTVGDNWLNKR